MWLSNVIVKCDDDDDGDVDDDNGDDDGDGDGGDVETDDVMCTLGWAHVVSMSIDVTRMS